MQILVAGLSHKTAPVPLLERLTIGSDDLIKALHQLDGYPHVKEGAVLSTCNRTEVYAIVSRFHGGAQDLRNLLSEFCHVAPEDFSDHLYTYHDDAATAHLFRVAAGLDSLVVGESEILGQVRRAFTVALDEGVAGPVLAAVYRHAVNAGRRARSETAIGRNPASISTAAVDLVRRSLGVRSLAGKRVVTLGAGKMGELTTSALVRAGATDVVVVNRTEERARELADSFGGTSQPFERFTDVLAAADVVVSSTASASVVVERALVERAMTSREPGRDLLIVDIAVPRDVDPAVGQIPGVTLHDIDDLNSIVRKTESLRGAAFDAVERIIAQEQEQLDLRRNALEAAPVLAGLARKGEQVRQGEIERARIALSGLNEQEMAAVDRMTKRIVAKLLHEPMESARRLASSRSGDPHVSALRDLFDLD